MQSNYTNYTIGLSHIGYWDLDMGNHVFSKYIILYYPRFIIIDINALALCKPYWSWEMSWWRHQMETFSALLAICAGNSPVPGEFPAQWPVTRSFDVLFDLRLNKRFSKQSWGWCFETASRSLWRHYNVYNISTLYHLMFLYKHIKSVVTSILELFRFVLNIEYPLQ